MDMAGVTIATLQRLDNNSVHFSAQREHFLWGKSTTPPIFPFIYPPGAHFDSRCWGQTFWGETFRNCEMRFYSWSIWGRKYLANVLEQSETSCRADSPFIIQVRAVRAFIVALAGYEEVTDFTICTSWRLEVSRRRERRKVPEHDNSLSRTPLWP